MGIHWQDGGYSAEVEIHLLVAGRRLPVANLGPDFLILRDNDFVPNGHATILVVVDGKEESHDVIVHRAVANDALLSEFAYA